MAAGCGGAGEPASDEMPSGGTAPGGTVPSETTPSGPPDSPAASLVLAPDAEAAIRADLETRVGVDASTASVVSIEPQTWPDGSMGCPQPGEMYTQAIVEGYRVVVSFTGAQYDYRISSNGVVRFCGAS